MQLQIKQLLWMVMAPVRAAGMMMLCFSVPYCQRQRARSLPCQIRTDRGPAGSRTCVVTFDFGLRCLQEHTGDLEPVDQNLKFGRETTRIACRASSPTPSCRRLQKLSHARMSAPTRPPQPVDHFPPSVPGVALLIRSITI